MFSKFKNNKVFILILLFIFLYSTNCAVYRNMRPTGEYAIIRKEKVKDEYIFRMVKAPQPERPQLVIEFGRYPVYQEHRKVKEIGETRIDYSLAWLSLAFAGVVLAATSWEEYELTQEDNGDTSRFYTKRVIGILMAIAGISGGM